MKTERHGTFSSSNMGKLMGNSKKAGELSASAKKYIKQVNHERKLGRAINPERETRPTSWGKFIERRVFELLGLEYRLVSKDRLFHPEIDFWSGAPDLIKDETVADVKAPVSLEVFCDKIDALQSIETYKEEFPIDYWQHVSNAVLLEKNGIPVKYFEAIIYVPFKSELEEIKEMARNYDGDQNSIAWINWATDDELPYLIEGGYYKNLNIIRFEVPKSDKLFLTERVLEAGNFLIQQKELQKILV